jgi:hypothetical protein
MKDLKKLHDDQRQALAAFRSEAMAQGFVLTDVGFESTKNIWLSRSDREELSEMVKNNIDVEPVCRQLIADGKAFPDSQFLD